METPAQIIDRLTTVNLKMWHNQELLYTIRRMEFDEFRATYLADAGRARELFDTLKRCCDLNVQRNTLIMNADEALMKMVQAVMAGDAAGFVQNPHKTY
jgi:hypothetical protein